MRWSASIGARRGIALHAMWARAARASGGSPRRSAEVVLHAGWRHEEGNPWDGQPIDSFQGRLWCWGGYQHEFNRTVYANVRGGVGLHVFRTDRFADRERLVAGGADVNLGFRFW